MSKKSRSGNADGGFNGLEALGFMGGPAAPAVAPQPARAAQAPAVSEALFPSRPAASVQPAAAVQPAGPIQPTGPIQPAAPVHSTSDLQPRVDSQLPQLANPPLTRRQLRELEASQTGGVPQEEFHLLANVANTSSVTEGRSAVSPVSPEPSYRDRGRRVESSSVSNSTATTRGGKNYSRSGSPSSIESARVVRAPARKRATSRLFSGAAMVFAAALLVGTTVPANAFMPTAQELADAPAPVARSADTQSMAVSADIVAAAPDRGNFTVTSYAEQLRARYGNITYTYAISTGAIRWPFPYVVPLSSGFGGRVAPCRGCSSMHMGVDFVPGFGTPIFAVADGVVTAHDIEGWGLGNSVVISHNVDGLAFDSVYAHMQTGSVVVEAGQPIKVGDLIGLVGSTGSSTGAHLHFEIHLAGVQVDPFAWLKANVRN